MASKKQNSNHEETSIDKVNSQLTEAGTKIANNKKIIYIFLAIIGIVAAFTLSYLFIYKNPHVEKSFAAFNGVETQVLNDSVAAEQYKAVANQYKGDMAGKLAALSAGEALYNEGNYEEAAEYLKRFSSDDDVLDANVYALIGDCYVNLNKYDDALNYYNKSVRKANGNPQIVPRVLLKEANVYDAQQKYDKALECYQIIQNSYPTFKMGNGIEIDAYIAREIARMGN